MEKEQLDLQLSKIAALFLAIMVFLGTVVRPLFNEQDLLFSIMGGVNFILAIGCYWLIQRKMLTKFASTLVVLVTLSCLLPLLLISGGIDSQFTYLMPIIPVFTCLFANLRVVIVSSSLLICIALLMFFNANWFPDIDSAAHAQNKQIAKTFWLIVSVGVSASFGYYYRVQNQKIRALLYKYAYIDPLTEIPNRRFVEDSLNKEHARNQRGDESLGVMMIDIDNFKQFNDKFGHDIGDVVLKHVAESLKSHIRLSDVIGRFGGEEFLLIFPSISKVDLCALGNKLVSQINQLIIAHHGNHYKVTVSVGAVWQTSEGEHSAQSLVKCADKAMYNAKHQGRNSFLLYSDNSEN